MNSKEVINISFEYLAIVARKCERGQHCSANLQLLQRYVNELSETKITSEIYDIKFSHPNKL